MSSNKLKIIDLIYYNLYVKLPFSFIMMFMLIIINYTLCIF